MKLPVPGEWYGPTSDSEPAWSTLVLVCEKCKGARHGPDPRDVRKGLKRRLGKPKSLRVVEVHCLDVCPDGAVSVCALQRAEQRVELYVVDSEQALDRVADTLSTWVGDERAPRE